MVYKNKIEFKFVLCHNIKKNVGLIMVDNKPVDPSSRNLNSSLPVWQPISHALGHFFKKLSDLPSFLYHLSAKIKNVFTGLFRTPSSRSPHIIVDLKQRTVVPTETPPKISDEFNKQIISPPSPPQINEIPNKKDTASEMPPAPIIDKPQKIDVAIDQGQEAPVVIDVPDDGNCLFYSIGVGLKKKFSDDPEIQKLLNWDVEPNRLSGDLSQQKELLRKPGATLREQAANYLENNQNDDEIMIGTIGGIIDNNEVFRKKQQDEKDALPFLEDNIDQLITGFKEDEISVIPHLEAVLMEKQKFLINEKNALQTLNEEITRLTSIENSLTNTEVLLLSEKLELSQSQQEIVSSLENEIAELEMRMKNIREGKTRNELHEKQLEEQLKHLDIKHESIQSKIEFVEEGNVAQYLELTRKDKQYCGTAQILALAKLYGIGIKVIFNYGTSNAKEEPFNDLQGKKFLTIAHVNGNHFKLLP